MSTINTVGLSPDWPLIEQMVDEGYITARPHSEHPDLVIYNYTPKAQYDQLWNAATLMCRGLIAVGQQVVSRPFSKFFNHTEHELESLPLHLDYKVWEKLDGSLGISYVYGGDVRISTRGSMNSEQAKFATRHLKENYPDWKPKGSHTYLFEIIYPENRIVVDYGDKAGIVLLAILDTGTGAEVNDSKVWDSMPFETVGYIGNSLDLSSIPDRENKEGYVIAFENGFRVKIKHGEYIRLHKIITGTSNRTIWESLRDKSDMKDILDNIPDEFYEWVKDTANDLNNQFQSVMFDAQEYFDETPKGERREIAEYFKKYNHPAILFSMLDGKSPDGYIWKLIKPDRSLPFKIES